MRVKRLETNIILGVTNRWVVQLFESVYSTFAHKSMPKLSNVSTPLGITGRSYTYKLMPTLISHICSTPFHLEEATVHLQACPLIRCVEITIALLKYSSSTTRLQNVACFDLRAPRKR